METTSGGRENQGWRSRVIRFTYQHDLDPKALHKQFLLAGARPSMYSFYTQRGCWTLVMPDVEEGIRVRQVLDRLQIDYDEAVVTSRFE